MTEDITKLQAMYKFTYRLMVELSNIINQHRN